MSEKTLKESMIDQKIDQKEAEHLKQKYNHYFNEREETMNSTKFKVEDIFVKVFDVISKDSKSPEQITKPKICFSKNIVNINNHYIQLFQT